MKFATTTLITLALALSAQSSVLPLGGVITQIAGGHWAHPGVVAPGVIAPGIIAPGVVAPGLPWNSPVVLGHPPAAVHAAVSLPGAIPTAIHAAALPAHIPAAIPAIHGLPAVHAAHIPAVVGGHAGYVAKTRGAVHSAPLAGHLNSVANVNVAPAPGTI